MGHVGSRPPPLPPSSDPNAKPVYVTRKKVGAKKAPHILEEPSRMKEYIFVLVCVAVWAALALK